MSQSIVNAGSPVEAPQSIVQPEPPVGAVAPGGGEAVLPPCTACAKAKRPCIRQTASACVPCALKHKTCNLGGRIPKSYAKGKGTVHQAELSKLTATVGRIRASLSSQLERTVEKVQEGKYTRNQIPIILEHIHEDLDEQLQALQSQIRKLKDTTS